MSTDREEFEDWYLSLHGSSPEDLSIMSRSESGLDVLYNDSTVQLAFESYIAGQPQWVSVDDRLPACAEGKWSAPVIAMCELGRIYKLSYFKGEGTGCWQRTGCFVNNKSTRVVKWIPSPQQPKGANNEIQS